MSAPPYPCLLADPPWRFDDRGSRIAPDHKGKHYPTMSLAAIIGLGDFVRAHVARNAHLWLWAPNSFVLDGSAQLVARQWGFKPKQLATWIKCQMGMGHWMRNATEQLIFCTRGQLPPRARNVVNWITAKRGRHSAKPAESYRLIERISPGPRLEMFARIQREGWDVWGNQAPGCTDEETERVPVSPEAAPPYGDDDDAWTNHWRGVRSVEAR